MSQPKVIDKKGMDAIFSGVGTTKSGVGSKYSVVIKPESELSSTESEHFQGSQCIYDNGGQGLINSINAIAGPLKVASYVAQDGRLLSAMTNIAAGVVSVDHFINLTNASQSSKGVAGGAVSDTLIKNPGSNEKHAHTEVGSGSLVILSQNVSENIANCKVDYRYYPVSYETGTYDMNLNLSKSEN